MVPIISNEKEIGKDSHVVSLKLSGSPGTGLITVYLWMGRDRLRLTCVMKLDSVLQKLRWIFMGFEDPALLLGERCWEIGKLMFVAVCVDSPWQ